MSVTNSAVAFDPAVSLARRSLYRFAALTLLDPKAGYGEQLNLLRHERLLVESAALIRSLPDAVPELLGLGEQPLAALDPEPVLARFPSSAELHNLQYERAFGLLVAKACAPYETEYIDGKLTFQRSNALADLNGFYRAFGLETSHSHPERPDHIVQELEFMACLIELERRAADGPSANGHERQQVCQRAQVRFMDEHLAWWSPVFAKLLARECPDGFLAAAAVFLAALIPAERALLGVAAPLRLASPRPIEPPDACEGCQIAQGTS
jgi:TorA maturation chaperone TorD